MKNEAFDARPAAVEDGRPEFDAPLGLMVDRAVFDWPTRRLASSADAGSTMTVLVAVDARSGRLVAREVHAGTALGGAPLARFIGRAVEEGLGRDPLGGRVRAGVEAAARPVRIVLDCGPDARSRAVRDVCASLGLELVRAPAPWRIPLRIRAAVQRAFWSPACGSAARPREAEARLDPDGRRADDRPRLGPDGDALCTGRPHPATGLERRPPPACPDRPAPIPGLRERDHGTLSVPLNPSRLQHLVRALRKRIEWVKHTHLLDALALALGLRTYAALRMRVLQDPGGTDSTRAPIDEAVFVSRLRELGYTGPEHTLASGIFEGLDIWWLDPERRNPDELNWGPDWEDSLV